MSFFPTLDDAIAAPKRFLRASNLKYWPLCAVATLGACRDHQAPTVPPADVPRQLLHAGAGSLNAHFAFLPPIAVAPVQVGTFDATLAPVVEICELTDGQCNGSPIARFATTTGSGSELVRMIAADQHYIVNWHTDQFHLAASNYRVGVSVAGTELGRVDIQVAANAKDAKNLGTGSTIALVNGRTLPIKFRIDQGAVGVISASEGGVATLASGTVTLDFPAGAVEAEIGVTATPLPVGTDGTDTGVIPGTRFEFQPSPITFAEPVTLTLKLPTVLPPRVIKERLAVCRMENGGCRPILGSRVDVATGTVSAEIDGFSEYGVTEWPEVVVWTQPEPDRIMAWLWTAQGLVQMVPPSCAAHGHTSSWASDGERFAYITNDCSNGRNGEVRVVKHDGSENTSVFFVESNVPSFVRWSPGGDKLIVVTRENDCPEDQGDGCDELWTMNADGSGKQKLTVLRQIVGAAWSPDGSKIAFLSEMSVGSGGCLCVINAIGGTVQEIVSFYSLAPWHRDPIAWAPDGHTIAFAGQFDRPDIGEAPGLYLVNSNGSGLRRIQDGVPVKVQWSPVSSDTLIVAMEWDDTFQIQGTFVIQASTGHSRPFLRSFPVADGVPLYVYDLSFSPDGRRFVYHGGYCATVCFVNLDGSGGEQLLGLPGTHQSYDHPNWRPRAFLPNQD